MALTLRQSPSTWTPAYNPMWFILDSTNTGQTNFRYIADLYVSGSSGRQARMVASASATYSQGVFDISRVLESFFGAESGSVNAFDIDNTTYGFGLASNSMLAYEVKFGEQYGVASAVTSYTDLTVTGTKYAFNGAYTTHDFLSFDGSNIAIEDSNLLLNTLPYTSQYDFTNTTTNRYLHYITTTSGTVYFAEIKTYDSSGSLIQTAKIQNPYQTALDYSQRRQFFNCGINGINNATLYSGTQPVISDSVSFYTVNFRDWFNNSPLYQIYRFNNDERCLAGRTPINVHWLNPKGAFDSYEFTMVNRYKQTKKTETYRRKLGKEANDSYAYTASDAGQVVTDTRLQARYELTADWIEIGDTQLIMELVTSPVVYMEVGSSLYRVTIISPTEGELKTTALGDIDLSNIKIVAELSQEYHRQRG